MSTLDQSAADCPAEATTSPAKAGTHCSESYLRSSRLQCSAGAICVPYRRGLMPKMGRVVLALVCIGSSHEFRRMEW